MIDNIVSYLVSPHKFINVTCKLPDEVPINYVRVRYEYCGICGGDYSRFLGYRNDYPVSLGHEFVAKVVDLNSNVPIDYAIGDYVVSDFNYRCMKCAFCQCKKTHLCLDNDAMFFTNRAFSQYADIYYSYLVKTNIPCKYIYRATAVEPLSCIIHAMKQYDLSNIDSILIYGTGNIGMLCAFYLCRCIGKKVQLFDLNPIKQQNIASLFDCESANFSNFYDLVIEATNSSLGLLQCIERCYGAKNICSFSHLYGQNVDGIYDILVKKECKIYFPLRNGSRVNLHHATYEIENKWSTSFDKLIQIYTTDDINLPFEEKCKCNIPKQVIKFVVGQ